MAKVKAVVHGAISLVSGIANRKGATLGISLVVEAIVETSPGKGIIILSKNKTLSSRLINKTVEKILTKKELEQNKITISLESEIPTGYGLKSSSAISSVIALACAKIFKPKWTDQQILLAGIDASIESKVSITGAYDDACSCYFGGINVTDNNQRKIIHKEKIPSNLMVIIFVPKNRKRGNVKNLKILSPVFDNAWNLARNTNYFGAMIINGLATSVILNSDPKIIINLLEKGALAASISGNGPAIAAIVKKEKEQSVKKVFSSLDGHIIVSKINNEKAEVYEL